MSSADSSSARDAFGRWLPGQSGNPAGKAPGTPNRATMLAAALADHEGHTIARVVIDKALSGDAVAARFVIGHLTPRPRGRAIALALPEGARAGDVVAAFNATLLAMAAGEITPDEALTITRVFDGRIKALKAWDMERELTRWNEIPGDALFEADEEEEDDDEAYDDEDDDNDDDDDGDAPADTLTEPSPAGRGQGEGASPANDLHPDESPRPDPPERLSKGPAEEGARAGESVGLPAAADAAPTPSPESAPPLLHSACIQPSPATIAGRRRAAELARRQWLRELS